MAPAHLLRQWREELAGQHSTEAEARRQRGLDEMTPSMDGEIDRLNDRQ